jgi:hypothetical protein
MSYEPNTTYQDNVCEMLQEAVEDQNFELAWKIVDETRKAGFTMLSNSMGKYVATEEDESNIGKVPASIENTKELSYE